MHILLLFIVVIFFISFGIVGYIFKNKTDTLITQFQNNLVFIQKELANKEKLIDEKDKDIKEKIELIAVLKSENNNLKQKNEEDKKNIKELYSKMNLEFKNLANEILEEKSKKFSDINKNNIESILDPLGKKIIEFQKRVEQTNKEDISRSVALKTEIQKLSELNMQITKDAENLTKALKGDQKTQGDWGEFILESILEKSGLVKNREYFVQETFRSEDGKLYKPDVIIKLPQNKNIIIDSKVSLKDYDCYVNAEDITTRNIHIKKHILSIRNHLKNLSDKNYQTQYNLVSLDFVLMFIPIEPAFSTGIQHDNSLFQDAFSKNIVITSPTTLLATLKTIEYIWKTEYQNKNVQEIARQGGALYDKFVGFVDEIIKIGYQIQKTDEVYKATTKKLYTGRDNLISKAERLKKLGSKTSKELPQSILERVHE